jgi:UDP-3-O-[3-hydroxymyristoyl] glucosamine N-acyltransferase
MELTLTTEEVASIVEPVARRGSTGGVVKGIASLDQAQPGDLSFLGNPKYKTQVPESRASILLLPEDYAGEPRSGQLHLVVRSPSAALAKVCARLEQRLWPRPEPGIHPSAVVSPEAQIAPSASVGPLCVVESGARIGERVQLQAQVFVGRAARIGDDCWLMAGVTVAAECTLGRRVRLHPGVVVGADGFGYQFVSGRHEKVPQVGTVILEDDVEVGANSTLDRARFSRTVVGEGTKIDNLVQVAHNVTIGKHCILCAQVGVSGSSVLEDYVILGGQVGVSGHIRIGKGAQAGGQTGIESHIPAGARVQGTLALPYMLERRIQVLRKRLPELFKRVDALEKTSATGDSGQDPASHE